MWLTEPLVSIPLEMDYNNMVKGFFLVTPPVSSFAASYLPYPLTVPCEPTKCCLRADFLNHFVLYVEIGTHD